MFKDKLLSFLHAISISDGGRLSLTNLLLIALTVLVIRTPEPSWAHVAAFTLSLGMYAYERVIAAQENERFWMISREQDAVKNRHEEDFKKLADQVQALQNQVVLSNRGY